MQALLMSFLNITFLRRSHWCYQDLSRTGKPIPLLENTARLHCCAPKSALKFWSSKSGQYLIYTGEFRPPPKKKKGDEDSSKDQKFE